jgi:hypothetical protein
LLRALFQHCADSPNGKLPQPFEGDQMLRGSHDQSVMAVAFASLEGARRKNDLRRWRFGWARGQLQQIASDLLHGETSCERDRHAKGDCD